MRQAWEEVQLEAIKADKAFADKQADWQRDTATRISGIHSERAAIRERMKALEEEELAKAKTDDEKAGIKKRYEGAGKQLETNTQSAFSNRLLVNNGGRLGLCESREKAKRVLMIASVRINTQPVCVPTPTPKAISDFTAKNFGGGKSRGAKRRRRTRPNHLAPVLKV